LSAIPTTLPLCSARARTFSASTPNARPITAGAHVCSCSSSARTSRRCRRRSERACRKSSAAGRRATAGTTCRCRTTSTSRRSAEWLEGRLGFDPWGGISTRHWLSTPQQALLELTAGAVFHDPHGELAAARKALAWYPDDVWLWLLACHWRRVDQEEPFVGRTAEVGDELGSRVIAARLVRDVMRLALLLERRYAPYSKWLGSAFAQLDVATVLRPALLDVLSSQHYEAREDALVHVVEELAARHNALRLTPPVDGTVRPFHARPFRVLGSARFVDVCLERETDPRLRSMPLVGAIDQFVDSTDVLSDSHVFAAIAAAYDRWTTPEDRP